MASLYRISTRTYPLRLARAPTAPVRLKLRAAAHAALLHQNVAQDTSVCVVYSADCYLQQLNHQFLGVDAATDVLAFTADGEDGHLGDVIISAQRASRSAQHSGHGITDELQLLTVHGTLHLLGYDHNTIEKRRRMWKIQAEIIALLGLSIRVPTSRL